jgi:pimeloyl-ACP methyl ester carboxylesterase
MMRSPETLQRGRRVKRASRSAGTSAAKRSRSAGVIGSYERSPMPFIATPCTCGVVAPMRGRGGDVRAHPRRGGSAWDWHLVAPALREHGHDAVAVDLPCEDQSAGWEQYADAVVQAIGDRRGVVVMGHSLGGFTAPLVCVRVPVDLLVLVAAMIPSPGERFADWWANAGYPSRYCIPVVASTFRASDARNGRAAGV